MLFKCLGTSRCGAACFKGLKIRGADESCSVTPQLKTGSANSLRLYLYVALKHSMQGLLAQCCVFKDDKYFHIFPEVTGCASGSRLTLSSKAKL